MITVLDLPLSILKNCGNQSHPKLLDYASQIKQESSIQFLFCFLLMLKAFVSSP